MSLITLLKRRPAAVDLATGTPSTTTVLLGDNGSGAPVWGPAPGGGGGGGGAVGALAVKEYNPSTLSSYSLSATSLTAIDATNLVVTFTAPTSGKVLVRLVGMLSAPTSTYPNWGLLDGSTQVGNNYNATQSSSAVVAAVPIYVTGLTAGQVYTWKWAYKVSAGTANQFAGGGGGTGGNGNIAVMEVWAA